MELGYFTMPLHPPGSDLANSHERDPSDSGLRFMTLLKQEVMPRLADLS